MSSDSFRAELKKLGADTYARVPLELSAGARVTAFHPRMLGVIKEGAVFSVGRKYVVIDFGELLGGRFRVPIVDVHEVIA